MNNNINKVGLNINYGISKVNHQNSFQHQNNFIQKNPQPLTQNINNEKNSQHALQNQNRQHNISHIQQQNPTFTKQSNLH